MTTPRTSIRLIELYDAEALAAHLGRDAEAFARWDPERAPEWYTPAEQRSRIEGMLTQHHNGEVWPGVVLADDVVIGQVTAQHILRRAWRKAELGCWIAYPYQGQGHATRTAGGRRGARHAVELAPHPAVGAVQHRPARAVPGLDHGPHGILSAKRCYALHG
jgi:hypothetical protein